MTTNKEYIDYKWWLQWLQKKLQWLQIKTTMTTNNDYNDYK